MTNVQRKKLEKSGKIQEDLGKLEALERFELLYRAFSVWALQIVAAQVSTCARFLPTRTFHMFNCRLGGAFSHHVRSLAFLAKMQTSDQLAGRKHIINEERKAWFVGFSAICCMQQNQKTEGCQSTLYVTRAQFYAHFTM